MILQPEESEVVTGEDNYIMAVLPLEEAESIPESLDDDVDLSLTTTTSISVIFCIGLFRSYENPPMPEQYRLGKSWEKFQSSHINST